MELQLLIGNKLRQIIDEPQVIRKLDECVVNRIAAGEIIQRPANALKELIENSLDAKATNISITVKAGGLKYLQIQDNGTGIRRDNLEIVCERFTTSKLKCFEDLREISTYGFRGEALASISHVAHLTILSKTASEKCAFKASYEDGKLKGTIKACAGNQGTQITVEDLFYNVVTRKKALKSPSEEFSKILDVVGSYAIHNSAVGFTLKKFGENANLRTPIKSSVIENVRTVYGNSIARELMELSLQDESVKLNMNGYITNVNYSHKKGTMLLFINHRLVESVAIRKSIDSVYTIYLPKNGHSFVYLSLELDPKNVDVNVHPTKHEVHFLHEELIIDKIKCCVEAKLLTCNTTRVMYTQGLLPGATIPLNEETRNPNATIDRTYANNMVRNDSCLQKIDKFFGVTEKIRDRREMEKDASKMDVDTSDMPDIQIHSAQDIMNNSDKNKTLVETKENVTNSKSYIGVPMANEPIHSMYIDPKESFKTRSFGADRVETTLTSVRQLRLEVEQSCNMNLREILANLIFIGCIDPTKSLIQYSTKLYLCDTTKLAEELFYETLLYDFQNFGCIQMSNPLPIQELAVLALDLPDTGWTEEDGDKTELAQEITKLLIEKSEMLLEYFSIEIDTQGNLLSLPLLLDYTPFMGALPVFIVRLATDVNWKTEKECFESICRQTAIFYSQPNPDTKGDSMKVEQWKQEHIIYPALRKYFLPPREFASNGAILQIANLPDLYKVFERC